MARVGLAEGIITNAADATRVCDVLRFLPMVLLRDVAKVRATFDAWRDRMIEEEARHGLSEAAAARANASDHAELTALVRDLGLERRRWLPLMLRWEFQRAFERVDEPLAATLPVDQWPETKPQPKQRPNPAKDVGSSRLEDLHRDITWFVACEVNGKPIRRFAIEHGVPRQTVQSAIRRAIALLDCIDADSRT